MDSDCDLYLVFDNTLPYGNVLVCLFMLVLFMLTQRQNLQFIKCLTKVQRKRPSVNYAKDWLGQLFLIPGLIPWHEKGIAYGCDHYGTVNNQPGDSRASLLLTNEKAVFCNLFPAMSNDKASIFGTSKNYVSCAKIFGPIQKKIGRVKNIFAVQKNNINFFWRVKSIWTNVKNPHRCSWGSQHQGVVR